MLGKKANDFITVKDVPAHDFIVAYAQHLKKNNTITVPDVGFRSPFLCFLCSRKKSE